MQIVQIVEIFSQFQRLFAAVFVFSFWPSFLFVAPDRSTLQREEFAMPC